MADGQADGQHTGAAGEAAHGAATGKPDVEVLSEKVYRLLLADVRLESARGGRGPGRG